MHSIIYNVLWSLLHHVFYLDHVPSTGNLLTKCISTFLFLYLHFIMQWSKAVVASGALHLPSVSQGSPRCSGDVCRFRTVAWCSDILSPPTLAANVPISGLLRRGGSTGGGEHRRTRDTGERDRARV